MTKNETYAFRMQSVSYAALLSTHTGSMQSIGTFLKCPATVCDQFANVCPELRCATLNLLGSK